RTSLRSAEGPADFMTVIVPPVTSVTHRLPQLHRAGCPEQRRVPAGLVRGGAHAHRYRRRRPSHRRARPPDLYAVQTVPSHTATVADGGQDPARHHCEVSSGSKVSGSAVAPTPTPSSESSACRADVESSSVTGSGSFGWVMAR